MGALASAGLRTRVPVFPHWLDLLHADKIYFSNEGDERLALSLAIADTEAEAAARLELIAEKVRVMERSSWFAQAEAASGLEPTDSESSAETVSDDGDEGVHAGKAEGGCEKLPLQKPPPPPKRDKQQAAPATDQGQKPPLQDCLSPTPTNEEQQTAPAAGHESTAATIVTAQRQVRRRRKATGLPTPEQQATYGEDRPERKVIWDAASAPETPPQPKATAPLVKRRWLSTPLPQPQDTGGGQDDGAGVGVGFADEDHVAGMGVGGGALPVGQRGRKEGGSSLTASPRLNKLTDSGDSDSDNSDNSEPSP